MVSPQSDNFSNFMQQFSQLSPDNLFKRLERIGRGKQSIRLDEKGNTKLRLTDKDARDKIQGLLKQYTETERPQLKNETLKTLLEQIHGHEVVIERKQPDGSIQALTSTSIFKKIKSGEFELKDKNGVNHKYNPLQELTPQELLQLENINLSTEPAAKAVGTEENIEEAEEEQEKEKAAHEHAAHGHAAPQQTAAPAAKEAAKKEEAATPTTAFAVQTTVSNKVQEKQKTERDAESDRERDAKKADAAKKEAIQAQEQKLKIAKEAAEKDDIAKEDLERAQAKREVDTVMTAADLARGKPSDTGPVQESPAPAAKPAADTVKKGSKTKTKKGVSQDLDIE